MAGKLSPHWQNKPRLQAKSSVWNGAVWTQTEVVLHLQVILLTRVQINVWEVGVLCMCVPVQRLLLWWFSRQVGNQCSDGADVRYDPKHNGEHWEPQGLARRCVRPLKISLSRCLVGLRNRGERREIRIRREKGICHDYVLLGLYVPPHSNHMVSPYYSMFYVCITPAMCASCITLPSFLQHSAILEIYQLGASTYYNCN